MPDYQLYKSTTCPCDAWQRLRLLGPSRRPAGCLTTIILAAAGSKFFVKPIASQILD